MSELHLQEQTGGEFYRELERLLQEAFRVEAAYTRQLLERFSDLRSELRQVIEDNEHLFGALGPGELAQLQASLDDVLLQAANDIQQGGLTATQESWAFGYEQQRQFIEFGVEVEAGVGEAGRAYYAPEVLAPWPGYAIERPPEWIARQVIHEAFTFDRIVNVTEEMRSRVKTVVTTHFVEGVGSPYTVMREITHVIGIKNMRQFRELGTSGVSSKAENIYRTEIIAAQNYGKQEGLIAARNRDPERFGALKKIWLATGDDRTRDSHIDAHGQVIPIDDVFTVGGHPAQFPGDPQLPIRERARCRCTQVPYMEGWGAVDELIGPLSEEIDAEKERREREKSK